MVGFVDGEGSFHINRSNNTTLTFSLGQSIEDLALMLEIKNFFNNLPGKYKIRHNNEGVVSISTMKGTLNQKDAVLLSIIHKDYIQNILIPFFDTTGLQSKKQLDYLD
jgi:hypothetical protein